MSIPLQMASDSFIQVDRISRYRSHPGLPWQKTLPVNAILKDFSLTLRQHERVGLLGCSGCGKSTLLKAIHHSVRLRGPNQWLPAARHQRLVMGRYSGSLPDRDWRCALLACNRVADGSGGDAK